MVDLNKKRRVKLMSCEVLDSSFNNPKAVCFVFCVCDGGPNDGVRFNHYTNLGMIPGSALHRLAGEMLGRDYVVGEDFETDDYVGELFDLQESLLEVSA